MLTTITIEKKTLSKLAIVKYKVGAKNYSKTLDYLINQFQERKGDSQLVVENHSETA